MTFGERITLIRKQLKLSQEDLAKKIGTSAPIVGRYEREEIKPSIDVAAKLADALGVSLDYLLGKSDKMVLDKKNLQRLEDIEQLADEDKSNIFYTIDNLIKAAKLKNIAAL
ncbi:MAG TPA: helix-turn-helix transcriptional regulator [Saprospiraceae bacterium]|nr:helix-turn-helix transcriptional regulator [Saprospiraceae bacterium]HQW56301.1 helix-turn-helix transcriptional regulator [Saprospiraceae bacterium]